jgi:hypothetical protein
MGRFTCALLLAVASVLVARPAGAQGFVQGFGGTTVGQASLGTVYGGAIGVPLGSHVQLIGEAGYMRDVLPSTGLGGLLDLGLGLAGVDLRMPAFYADGGVRVLTSSRSPIRGYVEVTAGAARLSFNADFDGSLAVAEPFVDAALSRVHVTEPLVGVGAGIILQPGPLVIDLGYRLKRIYTASPINASQVRAAVGVAF